MGVFGDGSVKTSAKSTAYRFAASALSSVSPVGPTINHVSASATLILFAASNNVPFLSVFSITVNVPPRGSGSSSPKKFWDSSF